ncbi:peroxisomal NAD-malate dehydrogenase 2, partial [Striga asiatica]
FIYLIYLIIFPPNTIYKSKAYEFKLKWQLQSKKKKSFGSKSRVHWLYTIEESASKNQALSSVPLNKENRTSNFSALWRQGKNKEKLEASEPATERSFIYTGLINTN